MPVLSPSAILQPRNPPALQSSLASIPIPSRLWLALIFRIYLRAEFGSPSPSLVNMPFSPFSCIFAILCSYSPYIADLP